MNTIRRLFLFFLIGFVANVFGRNIILKQSNDSGIYQKGEKIRVTVFFKDAEPDSFSVKIRINYSGNTENQKIRNTGGEVVIFDESVNGPASLIFEVRAGREFASIGLVVDPGHFTPGTGRPKDMDRYWQKEKKELRALEMDVKSLPVDSIKDGFVCSDVEMNCTGPKPARGYFAKPDAAKPKSLPIVLFVHAAGVQGSWCLSKPENAIYYAKMGKGALCFDLNAHGMLNGQPKEYYTNLEKGELKDYFLQGVESRSDFYFRGMYLRLLRTLDFLTAQLLKDCKATLVTEIGFIDLTCPSTSVYAAINQAKGEKITFGVPYRGHHLDQKFYQEIWENTVYKPKMDFIADFLK
ncbi:acetylxylan esterase [candidate division KSB1 bacterium]|nr:acetylxylan esterase [candidate division KSB1 bacterium]